MQIRVQFYSYLKDLTGCSATDADLPADSDVEDLLNLLHVRFPRLAGSKGSTLVAVGVEYAPRNAKLRDGDEVSLFPPVQGG